MSSPHSQHRRNMPQVTPRKTGYKGQYTEDFNKMLNRFKRACNKAGVVQEVKKRQFYVKPTKLRINLTVKSKEIRNLRNSKPRTRVEERRVGSYINASWFYETLPQW